MMTRRKLFRYFDAEPFVPFRIETTSGEVFEIRHPEMIFLSKSYVYIHTWMSEEAKEREHRVSLSLIESIEPLHAAEKRE